jgi:5-methylcytosine-specific restriction enzyme A
MKRRSISQRERLLIFNQARGICHICGGKIGVGEAWDVEHVVPLAQGGEDGGDNIRPAHVKCHRAKTAKDATDTAEAKRREARHIGIKKQSRNPLPGTKASGLRKKLNGKVERR